MLKKEAIEKLAKLAKLDLATLQAAISSTDEQDVEILELSVFTTDELATRDTNTKRTGYNEGKDAGIEIAIKDQKEKLGLEFEGKSIDKFTEALQSKILKDAKVEPNAKLQEKDTIIKNLQNSVEVLTNEKKGLETQMSTVRLDSTLLGMFPQNLNPILQPNEVLNLMKNEYSFVNEEGKMVVKKNGEILRDSTTQSSLEPKSVIESYLKERKFIIETGGNGAGRGGANDTGKGGVFLKLSELTKSLKEKGIHENSSEFTAEISKAKEANPDFDLNS